MLRVAIVVASLVFSVGCLSGKHSYTPPSSSAKVLNSVVVDGTKDEVWQKLVTGLGREFFVINNLDKESGLINVSYSGDPERYVDCGLISSWVSNLRGKREYVFPASRSMQQFEENRNGTLLGVTRRLELEGRMNILVQPVETVKTQVTCNTRYILTKSFDYYCLAAELYGQGSSRWNAQETTAFNTGEQGRFPKGGTICQCSGEFERQVLALVSESP